MLKKVKLLGSRVLVKREEAKTSKGGILLPETAQEKPRRGEVVSVGPGKIDKEGNLEKMSLKVGDKVLFTSYSGTAVPLEDELGEYLILQMDDILAVMG